MDSKNRWETKALKMTAGPLVGVLRGQLFYVVIHQPRAQESSAGSRFPGQRPNAGQPSPPEEISAKNAVQATRPPSNGIIFRKLQLCENTGHITTSIRDPSVLAWT